MAYKYLDNAVKSIEYQLNSAYSHGYSDGREDARIEYSKHGKIVKMEVLGKAAFAVLHQYCSSISPHDCIRCTFYEHCPECFIGCPGDQGEVIRKLQSNE